MPRRSSPLTPLLLLAAVILTIVACNRYFGGLGQAVEDLIAPPTPREAFIRDSFELAIADWDTAYARARTDSLLVDLPYREQLRYPTTLAGSAVSLRFFLPPGRRLTAAVTADTSAGPVFAELFSDTDDVLERSTVDAPIFTYEASSPRGEELLLLLQAAPSPTGTYELLLRTESTIIFPVAGKDARAIKSFWGDVRGGGSRLHEGNDIFAPRGTPLLAVADGRISSTRTGGLGGKTVWLRDGEGRGLTYYYAHLDSQLVRSGATVQRGDTVGLVGNTGNARTTPPHLHFGIYRNGARDPYPYLLGPDEDADVVRYPLSDVPQAVPARGRHYLRQRPQRDRAVVIRELTNEEPVTVLGATDRYYRVRTGAGEVGFVNFD